MSAALVVQAPCIDRWQRIGGGAPRAQRRRQQQQRQQRRAHFSQARCASRAMVWIVLPSPISSARMPAGSENRRGITGRHKQ